MVSINKSLIIGVVILIVMIAGIVYYLSINSSHSGSSYTSIPANATPNLSTYTNTTLGFSIQYPAKCWNVISNVHNGTPTVLFSRYLNGTSLLVAIHNATNVTTTNSTLTLRYLQAVVNEGVASEKTSYASEGITFQFIGEHNITIDSHLAIQFTYTVGSGSNEAELFTDVLIANGKLYTISFSTYASEFESVLGLGQALANSFTLLNK